MESLEAASSSTPPARAVCANPTCDRRGEVLPADGKCPHCWSCAPVVVSPPADDERDRAASIQGDVALQRAERVSLTCIRMRVSAKPIEALRIPSELCDEAVRPAVRASSIAGAWDAMWSEPGAPLRPFHSFLAERKSATERVELVGRLLAFFARTADHRLPPVALFEDAVWANPQRDDDFVLLAGGATEESWASVAARFVFTAWAAASDTPCDAASSDDALRWLPLLRAVEPAAPPEAVALLRDALCNEGDIAWLSRAWADLPRREGEALAADVPFRYGAAQRSGRRKGSDRLLPGEYQQDRWCCARVRVGDVDATLLALADGVSTAEFGSGAVAASRAIAAIERCARETADAEGYLRVLVRAANDAVLDYGRAVRPPVDAGRDAPASTLTLALVEDTGQVTVAWVGDTPAYGWEPRRRTLVPLNFAQQGRIDAVARGVNARTARDHEDSQRLVNYLGAESCAPEVRAWRLSRGGGVVLATDGFVDGFADDRGAGRIARAERKLASQLIEACRRADHLQHASEELCVTSDAADGHDNLSVLALVAGDLPSPAAPETVARTSNGAEVSARGSRQGHWHPRSR
jgi:serine/threonine protein phosphatase PrpC